jgi:hypothetical protein
VLPTRTVSAIIAGGDDSGPIPTLGVAASVAACLDRDDAVRIATEELNTKLLASESVWSLSSDGRLGYKCCCVAHSGTGHRSSLEVSYCSSPLPKSAEWLTHCDSWETDKVLIVTTTVLVSLVTEGSVPNRKSDIRKADDGVHVAIFFSSLTLLSCNWPREVAPRPGLLQAIHITPKRLGLAWISEDLINLINCEAPTLDAHSSRFRPANRTIPPWRGRQAHHIHRDHVLATNDNHEKLDADMSLGAPIVHLVWHIISVSRGATTTIFSQTKCAQISSSRFNSLSLERPRPLTRRVRGRNAVDHHNCQQLLQRKYSPVSASRATSPWSPLTRPDLCQVKSGLSLLSMPSITVSLAVSYYCTVVFSRLSLAHDLWIEFVATTFYAPYV